MEIDPMDLKSDIESDIENDSLIVNKNESIHGFNTKLMFSQKLIPDILSSIKSSKLELKKEKIFKMPSIINTLLRRENKIYYFVNSQELHVDISDVSGEVYLPLITLNEIQENLLKIDQKSRSSISMIHLGAIKILIKSEFQEGINTPIKLALIDNRINDQKDCILGSAKGNLAYGKFMFTFYPKFGLSLDTKNINKVLSLVHLFERKDLMNKGDKPFSVTYLVSYALTNSHHSIDYRKKEYIEIDDIFSKVGSVQERKFCEIYTENKEVNCNSWAVDIAKGKRQLINKESFKGKEFLKGESSKRSFEVPRNHFRSNSVRRSDNELLLQINERVDLATKTLKELTG